jgi:hypothetical protein
MQRVSCLCDRSLLPQGNSQGEQARKAAQLAADRPIQGDALARDGTRLFIVHLKERHVPQNIKRCGDPDLVIQFPRECQGIFGVAPCFFVVALLGC